MELKALLYSWLGEWKRLFMGRETVTLTCSTCQSGEAAPPLVWQRCAVLLNMHLPVCRCRLLPLPQARASSHCDHLAGKVAATEQL